MSTTATKIPLAEAQRIAEAFTDMLRAHTSRWVIAGSVRRGKPFVGDIEHLVIPLPTLWPAVDELTVECADMFSTGDRPFNKAIYPNGTPRWGTKLRGITFGGVRHEIFTADEQNWGNQLVIRTGPAVFSESMVTRLRGRGYRNGGDQHVGYVWDQNTGEIAPCPTEEAFFQFCGVRYIEPSERKEQTP